MAVFEELKSQWEKQSQPEIPNDGSKQVLEKMKGIQHKQRITNIVLALTSGVLIFFFFYISAYQFQTVTIGLALMIGALLIRIGIELMSMKTLKQVNMTIDANSFKQQLTNYYKNRTKVHFISTPLIILMYCIGFAMLMPSFKSNLSAGFYTYILVSSIVLLVVLSLFIAMQIRKELGLLKSLNS